MVLLLLCLHISIHHAHWNITFQILITVSLLAGLFIPCNLSGSSLVNLFLSVTIRLVKSCAPLPFPSAFLFSQTFKVTPHDWIQSTRSDKCLGFLSFGGLLMLSLLSHSRASLTKLLVRMSTIFNEIKIKYNEGENARWHGQL